MVDRDYDLVGLDPGHGGLSTGCRSGHFVEAVWVSKVAGRIAQLLADNVSAVNVTRQPGKGAYFRTRAKRMADCDVAISLHVNANVDESHRGGEVYFIPGSADTEALARKLARGCPPALLPRKQEAARIVRAINGTGKQAWLQNPRNVLKRIRPPAALVEFGYASNMSDLAFLQSEEGMDACAEWVASAVGAWLRHQAKKAAGPRYAR